jgi:hypothetical protein
MRTHKALRRLELDLFKPRESARRLKFIGHAQGVADQEAVEPTSDSIRSIQFHPGTFVSELSVFGARLEVALVEELRIEAFSKILPRTGWSSFKITQ